VHIGEGALRPWQIWRKERGGVGIDGEVAQSENAAAAGNDHSCDNRPPGSSRAEFDETKNRCFKHRALFYLLNQYDSRQVPDIGRLLFV
jgi:hypothetical protein